MEDEPEDQASGPPDSLLPYDTWTDEAMRHVAIQALKHAAREGLPGEHHFYLTFRTDDPRTAIPDRLRAQYPEEMTIVLQHQFRDLAVDEAAGMMRVGLSFGGVSSMLAIPLAAITAFADPHVRFGMRFRYVPPTPPAEAAQPAAGLPAESPLQASPETPPDSPPDSQVVRLDTFRRRPPRDT